LIFNLDFVESFYGRVGNKGGKGGSLPLPQGKRPIIGRKTARSTVRRTTLVNTQKE